MGLTDDQKSLKRLVKRIVKAIKEPLENATRREADLLGREHAEMLQSVDQLLLFRDALGPGEEDVKTFGKQRSGSDVSAVAGASPTGDVSMQDADERTDEAVIHLKLAGKNETIAIPNNTTTPASKAGSCTSSSHDHATIPTSEKPTEPLSPPISTSSSAQHAAMVVSVTSSVEQHKAPDVFTEGGIAWYLEPFDPMGTTIHEERYTGRAVLRDMSEELSDMDEDTLADMGAEMSVATPDGKGTPVKMTGAAAASASAKKAPKPKKKKGRRQQWSR